MIESVTITNYRINLMIESVTITNYRNESITLTLRSPRVEGLYVRRIASLDPPKATISISETPDFDGGVYNSARATFRNIIMRLGFIPTGTLSVEDIRQSTYRYFPLKRPLTILVTTTNRVLEIVGYVESNTTNIFSKKSEAMISIMCPEAYFKTIESILTVFIGAIETFEFPWSNESTSAPLIEFGVLTVEERQNIIYDGDTETGVIITVKFNGDVEDLSISNTVSGQSFVIDDTRLEAIISGGFSPADVMTLNTVRGNKSMTLLRSAVEYNILDARVDGSDWLTVAKGDNDFFFSASLGQALMEFKIEYHPLYQGV